MSNNDIDNDQANDKDDIRSVAVTHDDLPNPSQVVEESGDLDAPVAEGNNNETSLTEETLQVKNNGPEVYQSTDHGVQDSINEFSSSENNLTKDTATGKTMYECHSYFSLILYINISIYTF